MIIQTVIVYAGRVYRIVNTIRIAVITFLAAAGVSFVLITGKFASSTFVSYHKKANRRKIAKKRAEVEAHKRNLKLRLEDGGVLVTEERDCITSLTFHQVLDRLHDEQLSCVQVLRAYQAKALEATETLNCVTEFIAEAEDWARNLDTSSAKLPLHGIPFSVKDIIPIAGYDVTLGVAKNLNHPAVEDAKLILALKSLGAIPFCRTNLPQLAMSFGSSNPIWGQTKNPFNPERSPGGSSSGEGALIGYGGSLFGIGSDIGGSLRVPSSFCGIATLKVTPTRFEDSVGTEGIIGLASLPGIMARDTDTLILIHKLLWENGFLSRCEPLVAPLLWQHRLLESPRPLRVAYYDEGERFPTTPGVRRAIRVCRQVLERNGHQLIPFRPPHFDENSLTCMALFHADQLENFDRLLEYEDVEDSVISQNFYGRWVPFGLRPLLAPFINMYSPALAEYFKVVGGRTTRHSFQLWNEMVKKRNYKKLVIQQWKDQNIDLCIGPTFICPPFKIQERDWFFIFESYTVTYNYVEFPAGVIPVTKENESDQELLNGYPDSDTMLSLVKQTTKGAVGMPIGIQVIGLPFQDELVLHGMKLLSDYLKEEPVT